MYTNIVSSGTISQEIYESKWENLSPTAIYFHEILLILILILILILMTPELPKRI